MDFDLNDEQREIKNTARELLAARLGPARVRELAEAGGYDDDVWGEMSGLGWPGIAIGEEHGGLGLGTVELAIVSEELGYACAPTPFLSNAAAGVMIAVAGSEAQRADRLPGIAAGSALGACMADPGSTLVTDADRATVVAVAIDGPPALLDREDARVERLDLIDRTRSYCTVTTDAQGDPLPGPIEEAMDRIAVLLAAELVGIAQRAMEMAVDYAKERHQFGRAIGSFQAVSHRCAEMLLQVEEARSLTLSAAWTADAEPDELPLAASMAKARASEAAWRVCASSLQVHGGIGFTWEHDLQFWLKRATLGAKLFGSASAHRERVAALSGLG